MFFFPSARSLHRRPIELSDRRLDRATLFPFFDGEGEVNWLLLAIESPARLILLEWRHGLVRKLPLRRPRLAVSWSELQDATGELADALSVYWHWDPWWLLTQDRLAYHPAARPLLATNAAKQWPQATGINFTWDLSRVVSLVEQEGENPTMRKFEPGSLPASPRPLARPVASGLARTRGEWRLQPFWQR